MADIELVIKIEEETYNRIMNGWMPLHKAVNLMENVQKGTPLPKGHGRLIDADAINIHDVSPAYGAEVYGVTQDDIEYEPTILEADKEEE